MTRSTPAPHASGLSVQLGRTEPPRNKRLPRVQRAATGLPPLPSRSARHRSTSLSRDGEAGKPGPARRRHSSRADGLRPASPGQAVRAPPRPPGARRAAPLGTPPPHLERASARSRHGRAPHNGTGSSCWPRSGGSSRACAAGPEEPGRGAPAPVPPRPVPSGLTQTTEGMLAPSPRTQSSGCIPPAKYSDGDARTAAILPRGGRRLLTLAPTRRARAPIRAFSAGTEAVVPRFRAAAAPRPVAGARDWLPARDRAISREEAEGTAAGASALSFPPASGAAPASASPCPSPPPLPAARPPERPRRLRSAGGGIHPVRWPWWAPAVGPSVPAEHGGAKRGLERGRTCAGSPGVPGPSRCRVAACSRAAAASPLDVQVKLPVAPAEAARRCGPAGRMPRGGSAFGSRILRHGAGVFARRSVFTTAASCGHRAGANGACCSGRSARSEPDCSVVPAGVWPLTSPEGSLSEGPLAVRERCRRCGCPLRTQRRVSFCPEWEREFDLSFAVGRVREGWCEEQRLSGLSPALSESWISHEPGLCLVSLCFPTHTAPLGDLLSLLPGECFPD